MSLEHELQQNTEALNRLADVIRAARLAGCSSEESTPPPSAPAAESPSELTYADIQKPFLKLVQRDRAKAVALLAELGVPTLKAIEGKPELFATVLEKING